MRTSGIVVEGGAKVLDDSGVVDGPTVVFSDLELILTHELVVGRSFAKEGCRNDLAECQSCSVASKLKLELTSLHESTYEHRNLNPVTPIFGVTHLLKGGRDMLFDIPYIADWNKIGDYRQHQTDLNTKLENNSRIDYDYKVVVKYLYPQNRKPV